ncbi:MAG: hypothetical protein JNL38_11690 [Myxococcales bacterium]|nr:hypothetical protein [Myxococcales bacterium]
MHEIPESGADARTPSVHELWPVQRTETVSFAAAATPPPHESKSVQETAHRRPSQVTPPMQEVWPVHWTSTSSARAATLPAHVP